MGLRGKGFRTFVSQRNGKGLRYEVVAWGSDGETEYVTLSPMGIGKDIIVTKEVFRTEYVKAD